VDIVVVYDIAVLDNKDQRRLRQVARTCEAYGVRVQDSVFECRLSHTALAQLKVDLEDTIDERRDSIYFYRILNGLRDSRSILGQRQPHEYGTPWIL